jgi:protein phosphatase
VEANTAVYRLAQENPQFSGMGTTVTAVQVVGSDIVWGHVGDSRLYLLHENHLSQLTEDHSLVRELIRSGTISADEASSHPQRNVLIRAIGNTETVRVDTGVTPWSTGDQLILCSDGLTNLVKNHEILQVLTAANVPGEMRLANLIALANERGGLDNITAILVQREDSK